MLWEGRGDLIKMRDRLLSVWACKPQVTAGHEGQEYGQVAATGLPGLWFLCQESCRKVIAKLKLQGRRQTTSGPVAGADPTGYSHSKVSCCPRNCRNLLPATHFNEKA